MMRAILGVLAGYAAWTVLWLGGNALFFGEAARVVGEGQAYTAVGSLLGVIVLSIVCSIVAGVTAAKIAGPKAGGAVAVMAVLLLLTGIGVQFGVWSLMPVWYHLSFLALIAPVSLTAGRLATGTGPKTGFQGRA
jgi:hypothetical protein